jgi:CheY-like chemotaxis protein
VAHDFNNLLTAILGYSELVLQDLGPDHPSSIDVREIRAAGQSAESLTRQLLAFSRRQILQPQTLDLNTVLTRVDALLQRIIGEDIELTMKQTAPLGRVSADPGQIEQVVLNLAVNARDAMPRGGTLTLSTRYADLDADDVKFQGTLPAGGYVVLSVRDTGEGMDEATKSHVFEPFFTTKENGRGTGLGLAMVYGIVQQSGGHIGVETERGKGACFEIHFPSHGGPAAPPSRETAAPSVKGTSARGGAAARILLVEDEELVRGFAKSALESQGYSVVEAGSGRAALDHVRANPRSIDMVLTDVVMPQMGGVELAGEIAALEPGVKILYMSGYAEGQDAGAGRLDGGPLLAKPFSPRQLLEKVQSVLGQ